MATTVNGRAADILTGDIAGRQLHAIDSLNSVIPADWANDGNFYRQRIDTESI